MPAGAASLHRCQAVRPIASLTLSGARCISPITRRRRISRFGCMRTTRTRGSTSYSGRYNRGAISCMCPACKDRATSLHRTSATLVLQRQARAVIPVLVVEHRHLRRRLRRHLPLQRQPRLPVPRRRDRRLRRGLRQHRDLVLHLLRDSKDYRSRKSIVAVDDSLAVDWNASAPLRVGADVSRCVNSSRVRV